MWWTPCSLRSIDKRLRSGFSVIEIIMVVSILAVVSTAVWKIFRGGRTVYDAGVEGMDLNFEAQKAMIRLGEDLRKANYAEKPSPGDIGHRPLPGDGDLADYQTLIIVQQTADFSRVASGPHHIVSTAKRITYKFEVPEVPEQGPYVLTRQTDGDAPVVVAKRIQFGWFQREMAEKIERVNNRPVVTFGRGPRVVTARVELEAAKVGTRSQHGYKVIQETAFQLRGSPLP